MEADNLVDQEYSIYYPELDHEWGQANQVLNVKTGVVNERRFNLLEFDNDFVVTFVNSPPEPEPYYASGEEVAQAYFEVTRTCRSKVYLGADDFEIGGTVYPAASGFKRWGFLQTTFDYQRKYLDVEVGSILWRNKPPILPATAQGSIQSFDDYQLIINDDLERTAIENIITLAIPQGVWGLKTSDTDIYFVNSPEDITSVDSPVPTSGTTLITKPYVQFRKQSSTKTPFRLSLRGRRTKYLPGDFIPITIEDLVFLNHSSLAPRRNRLTPPGIDIPFIFDDLSRKPAITPSNTTGTTWDITTY